MKNGIGRRRAGMAALGAAGVAGLFWAAIGVGGVFTANAQTPAAQGFDPTANPGELLQLTARDVLALDAIGWNVAQATAVPKPGSWAMFGAGLGLLGWRARRRQAAAV